MDHIKKAIERLKEAEADRPARQLHEPVTPSFEAQVNGSGRGAKQAPGSEIVLNDFDLETRRVIAQDVSDARSRSFDMLRTQVLQTMDVNSWQLLGMTSPTAGCGKTMVSVNLALSIARQPHRSVLLVDLDLQKPQVARTFGIDCEHGVVSVLEGRSQLSEALVACRVGPDTLLTLPCETSTLRSSAWMASQAMNALLHQINQEFKGYTVIFDLPPVLTADDVISILPQIDCVTLVAAAGITTLADIKECNKHFQSTSIVRVVFNKAEDIPTNYYLRYAAEQPSKMVAMRSASPTSVSG